MSSWPAMETPQPSSQNESFEDLTKLKPPPLEPSASSKQNVLFRFPEIANNYPENLLSYATPRATAKTSFQKH